MKKISLGILIGLLLVLVYQYFDNKQDNRKELVESSSLIQEQLKNVGKLIVTEGSFTQVYTYKDSKEYYLDLLSAEKKALIIVNARATVAYDLSQLEVELDPEEKILRILHIPQEEISIYPEIKYYDISQDYLNQFKAEDHNEIRGRVMKSIRGKIEKSGLMENAQNRLISELQKIYLLTSTLGWTLEYRSQAFESSQEIEEIKV